MSKRITERYGAPSKNKKSSTADKVFVVCNTIFMIIFVGIL